MQPPLSDRRTTRLGRVASSPFQARTMCTRRTYLRTCATAGVPALCIQFGLRSLAAEPAIKWPFEVSDGLFQIHADFEISSKSELLAELSQLSHDVAELLELALPQSKIHVVIFGSPEEYRRYMAHYYPALPVRRALFIQQRGTGMLFAHRHAELATDLRHETVHAILNEGTGPLPLWLDEGLAEYFEVPAAARWSGHSHLPTIRALNDEKAWTDLPALESIQEVAGMSSDNYQDAWSWVHFLLHRRNSTRRLFVEHLQSLRAGRPVAPLSRTVAKQIPNWRSEFSDHFQRLAPSS